MKVSVEDISRVKKKIRVDLPKERLTRGMERAYKRLQSRVVMDGFRKGKVPMSILEKRYEREVIDEVSKGLIEASLKEVMKERGISPISISNVEIRSSERGAPFVYESIVEIMPDIDPVGYRGMGIKTGDEVETVTDEDVDKAIYGIREGNAEYRDVDRGAKEGDLLLIDFYGCCEGEKVNGCVGTDYPLRIGENNPYPGFAEALLGVRSGERKEILLMLPDNFHDKSIASREIVFYIDVKSVKGKFLHEVNDEFAMDLGYDNLDSLKQSVREELKKVKERAERERLEEEIVNQLIEENEFEVPESLKMRYLRSIVERYGVCEGDRDALEGLKERYMKVAERAARRDIIIEAIARKEGIDVSMEEIERKIEEIKGEGGGRPGIKEIDFKSPNIIAFIKNGLLDKKVFDLIISRGEKVS